MTDKPLTAADLTAALQVLAALVDTIRAAGPAGTLSGHLYAALMDKLTLDQYDALIRLAVRSGLVELDNHMLRYIGPTT